MTTQVVKKSQNKNEDNHKFLWQGEWNCLWVLIFENFDNDFIPLAIKTKMCMIEIWTKLSFHACFVYDRVFSWIAIVDAYDVMDNAHYSISEWIGLVMIMFAKVQKLSFVIKILIWCWMWWGKRWETFLCTCVLFSKTIVAMLSQWICCDVVHSPLHEHWNRWTPKSPMVCLHFTLTTWNMSNCRMWQTKVSA
jgi:hypothetical protein